jgi:hypothetical protein
MTVTLTRLYEEITMTTKDKVTFLCIGFVIWAAATSVYRFAGSYFFERSVTEYWLNVLVSVILCAVVPMGLLKWQRVQQKDWLQGAICVALPAMLCEIPVLFNFSELMSNMQPEVAGRYAAYLFACYSSLIASGWLLSTKNSSQFVSKTLFTEQ